MRPSLSSARMPVSIEFSIARRKLVSCTSAFWIWLRRRMWRQVPSSIHTVSDRQRHDHPEQRVADQADRGAPALPRSTRPLAAGANGRSSDDRRAAARAGRASATRCRRARLPSASTTATVWRCVTSGGTVVRSIGSIEYSAISAPANTTALEHGHLQLEDGRSTGAAEGARVDRAGAAFAHRSEGASRARWLRPRRAAPVAWRLRSD